MPLHVTALAWDLTVAWCFADRLTGMVDFYRNIAPRMARTIVYNGDTDPAINSFATQNWTVALGFEETQAWRPWTLARQDFAEHFHTLEWGHRPAQDPQLRRSDLSAFVLESKAHYL